MKRRDRQTRGECDGGRTEADGGRTEDGMEDEEGIIYGRGKEPGGQNNSSRRNNRRMRSRGRDADGHRDAQRVTPTLARLTADRPKVGKRSEKTSKISQRRTFPDLTHSLTHSDGAHLIRSLVREANEEMKAALGIDDSHSQLANNRGTRSKKLTENFRFLSVISPVQELNVQRVSRGSLLGFFPR